MYLCMYVCIPADYIVESGGVVGIYLNVNDRYKKKISEILLSMVLLSNLNYRNKQYKSFAYID